ncbi:MAG: hypothetical protein C4527_13985 [Candidatus Omnitrophota bacterium]|jgi:quinone-modifying oxidoreductase subunit QmoC|nr:MAG: hypothetical protein C4527_13985 [Candidatus Omnitrophota bacterium]
MEKQTCETCATTTIPDKNLQGMTLDPDLEFIEEVSRLGGETFKKCYQCATCSATCPISPDDNPFPRKEMVWAMWGLKDLLLKDPDVWLCHQCNDCSAICPREGNPGDILASIRAYAYKHYAFPGFMGRLLFEKKFLPLVFGIPFVILLFVLEITGNLKIPEGEIVYSKFFPHYLLDPLFIFFALFATVGAVMGGWKFWNALKAGPRQPLAEGGMGVVPGLIAAVKEIGVHSQFNECEKANPRYYSHLLTFYGFLALFITTTAVFFGIYIFGLNLPMSLVHPIKILGNAGAIAFLLGTGLMLYHRFTDEEKSGKSKYNDWLFIAIMFGLAVSGILTEVFRLANIPGVAYPVYFVHLVLILCMIGYFPYSKFAHLLYRTIAIFYYKSCCVSVAVEEKKDAEEAPATAEAA